MSNGGIRAFELLSAATCLATKYNTCYVVDPPRRVCMYVRKVKRILGFVRPSVRLSVRPPVRPSVPGRPSVRPFRPSVRLSVRTPSIRDKRLAPNYAPDSRLMAPIRRLSGPRPRIMAANL